MGAAHCSRGHRTAPGLQRRAGRRVRHGHRDEGELRLERRALRRWPPRPSSRSAARSAASFVASSTTRPYSIHASPALPESRSARASSRRAFGLFTTSSEARSSSVAFSQFFSSRARLPGGEVTHRLRLLRGGRLAGSHARGRRQGRDEHRGRERGASGEEDADVGRRSHSGLRASWGRTWASVGASRAGGRRPGRGGVRSRRLEGRRRMRNGGLAERARGDRGRRGATAGGGAAGGGSGCGDDGKSGRRRDGRTGGPGGTGGAAEATTGRGDSSRPWFRSLAARPARPRERRQLHPARQPRRARGACGARPTPRAGAQPPRIPHEGR